MTDGITEVKQEEYPYQNYQKDDWRIKASCLQDNLKAALDALGKTVSTKGYLPVLSNVLIQTDKGRLKLTTTDLDSSLSVWIGAMIENDGAVTVDYKVLADLVKVLSPERVDFESFRPPSEEKQVTSYPADGPAVTETKIVTYPPQLGMLCGASRMNFKTISTSDFPVIDELKEDAKVLSVPIDEFRTAVLNVIQSAATDDSRPILAGIMISYKDRVLTVAAADRFQLSVDQIQLPMSDFDGEFEEVVPADKLKDMLAIWNTKAFDLKYASLGISIETYSRTVTKTEYHLGSKNTSREVLEHYSTIVFSSSWIEMRINCIDGKFPDYTMLVPKGSPLTFTFDRLSMIAALKRALVIARRASAKDPSITLSVKTDPDQFGNVQDMGVLYVRAKSSEVGNFEGVLDIGNLAFDAKEMLLYMTANRLMALMEKLEDDRVDAGFNGYTDEAKMTGSKAQVFRPHKKAFPVHVLMSRGTER